MAEEEGLTISPLDTVTNNLVKLSMEFMIIKTDVQFSTNNSVVH
jgi:hypothetical protein